MNDERKENEFNSFLFTSLVIGTVYIISLRYMVILHIIPYAGGG